MARITALDKAVFLVLNHGLVRLHLDKPMQILNRIGTGGAVWFALLFLLFVFGRRVGRRVAITTAVAIALGALISDEILKGLVQRPFPFDPTQLGQLARVVGSRPSGSSFPSGHAAMSFAAAAVLSRLGSGWKWIAWTLAALIAFAGIYDGDHFPLDVLAGGAVGLFAAWMAVRFLGDPAARHHRRL